MSTEAKSFKGKIRLVFCFIILFVLIIVVRLYFLQIVNGDKYSDRADRQYVNISTETFDRGSIFFEDKSGNVVSAASLKTTYTIGLNLKTSTSTDTGSFFKKINAIIPLDAATFYSKVASSSYIEIAKQISEEKISKIKALNLPGIIISKDKSRYYPGNSLAARTIGFVGYDDSGKNLVGRYGLEKYYDDTLGRSSGSLYVNTFAEIFSNIKDNLTNDSGREGDVVTSIDPEVQSMTEKVVGDINKKWDSKLTGAIIIDPNTGEIYSMAVSPNFDLNNFKNERDVSIFSNPLISDAYEMGSIIKPLTIAAGIDDGDITAKTTYNDPGFVELDGKTIYNFDKKARGIIDMQTVLNNSLNVGAVYAMEQIGKPKFLEYFKNYGIGTETGIDLPAEARGNISNLANNVNGEKKVEFATASFGQGISMTPIMTVRALSVLANGGKLIIPHVVNKISYKVGLSKNISYVDEAKQVLKKETSEEISRMLVRVVDESLANGTMKMKNYSIAAKTGTAQIARPASEGGGYYSDRVLHSFFGYFPAYNPRFLVFLYTVEPKNIDYASKTLTTPFFDITKYLINYYQITPDR